MPAANAHAATAWNRVGTVSVSLRERDGPLEDKSGIRG
jgi:hypothetical protein